MLEFPLSVKRLLDVYGWTSETRQILYLLMYVYIKDIGHVGPQKMCCLFNILK